MIKRFIKLGFKSYKEYLKSDYWKKAKKRYFKAGMPKYCIGCRNQIFQLHHRSYTRLGKELPRDLIPLCRDCHKKVHDYLKENPTKLTGTHKVLRIIFGWTKRETRLRFNSFRLSKTGFRWLAKDRLTKSRS